MPRKHRGQRVTGLAARMGRWSAAHRKTAILGWIAFVVVAFGLSIALPMTTIDQKDAAVGEAGRANTIIDGAFDLDETGQGEFVLVQSDTRTVDDPAFRATITETIGELSTFEQVDNLHSPLDAVNDGQISPDRHAALISYTPRGDYDEAAGYIDTIVARVDAVQAAHLDFYVASAGVSTEKALQELIGSQLKQAGLIAIPLTILLLLFVFRSLTGAFVAIDRASRMMTRRRHPPWAPAYSARRARSWSTMFAAFGVLARIVISPDTFGTSARS